MSTSDRTLRLFEGSDPLVTLTFTVDGGPYDFTGNDDVELWVKNSVKDADDDARFVYRRTSGEITVPDPATDGVLQVQFDAGDLDEPGVYRWRVDVLRNGKREILGSHPLHVEDV